MALNFPDPSASPWLGDNGVMYTWVPTAGGSGYWSGAAENLPDTLPSLFVERAGDNMTGDLTVGTDKIKLEASTGKITTVSTTSADSGKTLVTKDYVQGSSYWLEDAGSLLPKTSSNNVVVGATTNKVTLDASTGKATSAITVAGDSIQTLATKGYVDNSSGDGQIVINAGTGLTATGDNATANQSANTIRTLALDRTYTDSLYVNKTGDDMTGNLTVATDKIILGIDGKLTATTFDLESLDALPE